MTQYAKTLALVLLSLYCSPQAHACNWPDRIDNWAQFAAACRACGGIPRVGAICDTRGGGGGGYIPPTPNPAVVALQNANARYTQIIQNLPEDLLDRDTWLSSNRATAEDFASTAGELFTMMNTETANYWNGANEWHAIARHFDAIDAVYPARAASLRSQINEYSGYERRDEAMARNLDAAHSLDGRTTDELIQRTDSLRLQMEGDRQAVSDLFSVLLPPSMVIVTEDVANQLIRYWPVALDYPTTPLLLPAMPDVTIPAMEAFHLPVYTKPTPKPAPQYEPLSGSPAEIVGALESTAARLTAVYNAWSEISAQQTARRDGAAQKVATLQALEKRSQDAIGQALAMNQHLHDVVQNAETLDLGFQNAIARFAMQTVEGAIWREGKRMVMDTIRGEYKDFLTNTLDLTDAETFDHYAKGEGNIFSLPNTIDHAVKMKAVQNNILTLLRHGTDYASTAAQMMNQASNSELLEYSDQIFQGMSADSETLVKSSLAATNLPFPFKAILARYVVRTGH